MMCLLDAFAETFQEQETKFPHRVCYRDALVYLSHDICGKRFHTQMLSISPESRCVLENIIRYELLQ